MEKYATLPSSLWFMHGDENGLTPLLIQTKHKINKELHLQNKQIQLQLRHKIYPISKSHLAMAYNKNQTTIK